MLGGNSEAEGTSLVRDDSVVEWPEQFQPLCIHNVDRTADVGRQDWFESLIAAAPAISRAPPLTLLPIVPIRNSLSDVFHGPIGVPVVRCFGQADRVCDLV
jgi:hypothetical protein